METMAQNKPNVEIANDLESLAQRSVKFFAEYANNAVAQKGVFFAAISGGHSPKRFYELLGQKEHSNDIPWNKVQLFWVDERYVPQESPLSNYKLAMDTFLTNVPIPKENVHRIPTELLDSSQAAHNYETKIRQVFDIPKNQLPQFDLIVLGMGADGHTGSLFPNSYAPFDTEDLACVVYTLENEVTRITLTHPVLCNASHLAVLVSGHEKAKILKEVLTSEPDECRFPIHTLWPVLNKITWLVDSQAASMLK
ncbi:MAG: 6-phosphogluconolactonase [Sedimentisphaerales bacterium]|nr:6-phosphogluconolactonase [Sedimentisphaerales bacterium]